MKFDVVNSEEQWPLSALSQTHKRGEERGPLQLVPAGIVILNIQCCGAVAGLFGSEPEPPLRRQLRRGGSGSGPSSSSILIMLLYEC